MRPNKRMQRTGPSRLTCNRPARDRFILDFADAVKRLADAHNAKFAAEH